VALAAALAADPRAAASFERMAFTHRKEYARWIAEAKRADSVTHRHSASLTISRLPSPSARAPRESITTARTLPKARW
jgi:Bacteriocin-protection, YdeI or OmpD-Associated